MADDVRQKLIAAVQARFEDITILNGYETDLGNDVKVWRDMKAAPFHADNLDALNLKDVRSESSRDDAPIGETEHFLEIHAEAATRDNSQARDVTLRKFLADMVKAIGVDRHWTVSSVRLAMDTRIESTALDVKQVEDVLGGCQLVFTVVYRTLDFDPYTPQH